MSWIAPLHSRAPIDGEMLKRVEYPQLYESDIVG